MDPTTKNMAEVIIDVLKLIAIMIGGLWVYFRFRKENTHSPKVCFEIEATFFPAQGDACLAEFLMIIKNSGLVKHRFKKITLRVRGIAESSEIELWEDTQRVAFPVKIVDDADVLHSRKYGAIFVESGVTQKLTFVARIPSNIRFALARAGFEYLSGKTHSCERVFEVKTPPANAATASLTSAHSCVTLPVDQ